MGGWRYALLVGLRVICCGCGWFDLDVWVFCLLLSAGRACWGRLLCVCLFTWLVYLGCEFWWLGWVLLLGLLAGV